MALGNALFEAIISGRSGIVFSVEESGAGLSRIGYADRKIRLNVGEMLDEVSALAAMIDVIEFDANFPFILAAGERRSNTANCAIRDPAWLETPDATSLAIHSSDATKLGAVDGSVVRIVTKAGTAMVDIRYDDRQLPGTIALPNGLGMSHPDAMGANEGRGVSVNELTPIENKDKFVGTPFHKYVPARLEPL